jgi:hypothetical protein
MMGDADTQGAIAYNRRRLMLDGTLVASLGQVAGEPVLTDEVRAAGQIDAAFVRLVRAAQVRVLPPDAPRDGRLGPATIRAVREALGTRSRAVGLDAENILIPEQQVHRGLFGYSDQFRSTVLGPFYVSGGFMEGAGHAPKSEVYAIFSARPSEVAVLPPAPRNLGIDCVVTNPRKDVRAWYGGLVLAAGLDGGYGYRVTIETDVAYPLGGVERTVYQAYGHNAANMVRAGEIVEQGQVIARMGGTGQGGAATHGEHVDLRTWIDDGTRRVDVAPNALDRVLPRRLDAAMRPALYVTFAGFTVGTVWWARARLAGGRHDREDARERVLP